MMPANPPPAQLLPCPFCGGEDVADFESITGDTHIACVDCDARGPDCENEAEAIAAWNTRAPSPEREAFAVGDNGKLLSPPPEEPMSEEQRQIEIARCVEELKKAFAEQNRPSPERGELASLVERLRIMSKQRASTEMDDEDQERADWQGAYDWFCAESRWLLAALHALSASPEGRE